MNRREYQNIKKARLELEAAEAELEELNTALRSFEAVVDARLGNLLDQLSNLNAETASLDEQLRKIREERLFGTDLMRYLDGAPRPARPNNLSGLPPLGLSNREAIHRTVGKPVISSELDIPDIKVLYRKLARRYHPDLTRNDADRVASNEQMTEINQAYNAGDLPALMKLAGMKIPYGVDLRQPASRHDESLSDLEQVERKLKSVRQQINQLSRLPVIKLSLEVKLARHHGRDLLSDMATDLEIKVRRKLAERDYLQSQIDANARPEEG